MNQLTDQTGILIFGFGREGVAFYNYAQQHAPHVPLFILDDGLDQVPPGKKIAAILDAQADLAAQLKLHHISMVLRSPGISIYRDEFALFKKLDINITTGTNLWLAAYPDVQTIAITGTKGKSTTASLIHFILAQQGFDTAFLGNVGTPLLASEPAKDFTVLELSSYQTADLQNAPNIAVITNLFEEHLQWHQTLGNYHQDKLRLAKLDGSSKVFCLCGDEAVQQGLKDVANLEAIEWEHFSLNQGEWREADQLLATNVPFKGAHNEKNLALAFSVVRALLGAEKMQLPIDFTTYEPLAHRMQEHQIARDILVVDDSISTIPQATLSAFEVYRDRDVHLFVGGQDRGIDYGLLIDQLPLLPLKSLNLFGPVGARINSGLGETSYPIHLGNGLGEVTKNAFDQANAQDVFLLSPAAPSFDAFKNFAERGTYFVSQCKQHAASLANED